MKEHPETFMYRVVCLRDGRVWDFDTAYDVAIHMWGKYLPDFAVFKYGARWPRRVGGELGEYERALERWQPPQEDK